MHSKFFFTVGFVVVVDFFCFCIDRTLDFMAKFNCALSISAFLGKINSLLLGGTMLSLYLKLMTIFRGDDMGEPIKRNKKWHLSFDSKRRFGIELEINSDDGQNRPPSGKQPKGIRRISNVVQEAVPDMSVEVRGWEHTDGNNAWVLKPDSSCGMEICSPPLSGWRGLKKGMKVVEALANDGKVKADKRCSVHIHIEISDLNREQLGTVLAWWIKCEPVFLDAMPIDRKRNRYCQFLGMLSHFQHDGKYTPDDVINRVSDVKYYTCNANMYKRNGRQTIEFRIIEAAGCFDPYLIKNWIRLLIHFVERTKNLDFPDPYHEPKNDKERKEITPWTGLSWLDPKHVFTVLGFNPDPQAIHKNNRAKPMQPYRKFELSRALNQTRNWFIGRLYKYMSRHKPGGMRYYAFQELKEIIEQLVEQGHCVHPEKHLSAYVADELYGEDYVH